MLSDEVTIRGYAFKTRPTPTISGSPTVGTKLQAHRGSWSPSAGVHYTYQWYRQASATAKAVSISGATSSSYAVTKSSLGQLLSVRVTAHKSFYQAAVDSSDPTAAVTVAP
jgi:hypothetical protein